MPSMTLCSGPQYTASIFAAKFSTVSSRQKVQLSVRNSTFLTVIMHGECAALCPTTIPFHEGYSR